MDSRLLAGTTVIEVTVEGNDPSVARSFAVLVGDKTTAYMEELYEAYYFKPLDPPSLPRSPAKPNKKLNLAMGAVFGLVLGMGLAFFSEYWQGPVPPSIGRGAAEGRPVGVPALPKVEEVTEPPEPVGVSLSKPTYTSRIMKPAHSALRPRCCWLSGIRSSRWRRT